VKLSLVFKSIFMNTEMQFQEENLNDWWQYQRRKLNRGLLLSAAATFLLCGFIASVVVNPFKDYELIGMATIILVALYFLYAVFINLFVLTVAAIDLAYHKTHNSPLRKVLAVLGYWLILTVPMLSFMTGSYFVFGI
jgi:hypothetical protein